MTEDGIECDLCDDQAVDTLDVQHEETGEMETANLCEEHMEKISRYNRGEEVDWDV